MECYVLGYSSPHCPHPQLRNHIRTVFEPNEHPLVRLSALPEVGNRLRADVKILDPSRLLLREHNPRQLALLLHLALPHLLDVTLAYPREA